LRERALSRAGLINAIARMVLYDGLIPPAAREHHGSGAEPSPRWYVGFGLSQYSIVQSMEMFAGDRHLFNAY